eukprot:4934144-Amphidinium_carterae.1
MLSHDGYEAHRRLQYNSGDENGLLDRLTAWERMVEDHDQASAQPLSESVQCAVVQAFGLEP